MKHILQFLSIALLLSTTAHAQSGEVKSSGPELKFKSGGEPAKTDTRQNLKFSDPSIEVKPAKSEAPAAAAPMITTNEDDEPGFKTYIGYPKHVLSLVDGFNNLTSKFSYNGKDFNFSSSVVNYGLEYTYVATPSWKVSATYQRYGVSVPAGKVGSSIINDSKENIDSYGVDTDYCMISSSNFFRQYCLGGGVANDAYPVLKFVDGTHLEMGKVQDIVVGIHVGAQLPISEKIQFKGILGYNYGTGAGGAGNLSSENDTKLYARLELPWTITQNISLKFHGDYSTRNATIKGDVGNNKDKWTTDTTILGGGADLGYTF